MPLYQKFTQNVFNKLMKLIIVCSVV